MSILLDRLKTATYGMIEMSAEDKNDLLSKYELLATSIVNRSGEVIDASSYQILLNKTLFVSVLLNTQAIDLIKYTNLNKLLQIAVEHNNGKRSIKAFNQLHTKLEELIGQSVSDVDAKTVKATLEAFGLETVDDVETEEEEPQETFSMDEIEDIDTDGLFDDDEAKADEPFENMTDAVENETEELGEDETFSLEDLEELDKDQKEQEILKKEREEKEEDKEKERQKALETGDVSGKADDIGNNVEDVESLRAMVDNIISNIMDTYSKIYQPLFLNPPRGVLYTNKQGRQSIMCVGKSGEKEGVKVHEIPSISLFAGYIYGAIFKQCSCLREAPAVGDDGMYIKSSWLKTDGSIEYNYAPHIQVRNCMGVYREKETGHLKRAKTWSEFRTKLSAEIKPTIMAMLKRVDIYNPKVLKTAMESILELYTTIVLVNEFDAEKAIRLTIYSRSASLAGHTEGIAKAIINADPLSKPADDYEIMSNNETSGVREILIVTNKDKYRGEINFAYKTLGKIINSGGNVDISHTIVGTDLTGNPVELNLSNNAYASIGVVAGTRSGKGVLTMSLLASMIAANCPVVYLDYKPDMAGVFWKLERQYNKPMLAIDGQTSRLKDITPKRNYNAGFGCPKTLVDKLADKFNVIPYIKGVQIMNLIGAARVAGKMEMKHKMFFVLDEAQQCSKAIDEAASAIEKERDKNKPKSKQPETAEYKYLCKLTDLYKSVAIAATTFLNTNAGLGNMGALILGQQADASVWRGPFQALMLRCSVKFLGRGTVGGSQYGLNDKIPGVGMIGTGYFGLCQGNKPDATNTTILKSTLVLNDADFNVQTKQGGQFTGALLKNVTNEDIKRDIIENDMIVSSKNEIALGAGLPLGSANELVGFPGLIKFIGRNNGDFDLANALGAGYNEVYTVLNKLGIVGPGCPYANVEAYMYSAREDSLFTSSQLVNALNADKTVYQYMESDAEIAEFARDAENVGDGAASEHAENNDDIISFTGGSVDTDSMFGDSTESEDGRMSDKELQDIVDSIIAQSGLRFTPENLVKAKQVCILFLRKRRW